MNPDGRSPKLAKLSPETLSKFFMLLRQGCYDHVAASALGIAVSTYYRWMQKGRQAKSGQYRKFFLQVEQQLAVAHAAASVEVRTKNPEFWLTHGPAKQYWKEEIDFTIHPADGEDGDGEETPAANTLLSGLRVLEEMGWISVTAEGRRMLFSQESETVEVESPKADNRDGQEPVDSVSKLAPRPDP